MKKRKRKQEEEKPKEYKKLTQEEIDKQAIIILKEWMNIGCDSSSKTTTGGK